MTSQVYKITAARDDLEKSLFQKQMMIGLVFPCIKRKASVQLTLIGFPLDVRIAYRYLNMVYKYVNNAHVTSLTQNSGKYLRWL